MPNVKNIDRNNRNYQLGDKNNHVHLMTPEWGGDELTSTQQSPVATLINHVKILR